MTRLMNEWTDADFQYEAEKSLNQLLSKISEHLTVRTLEKPGFSWEGFEKRLRKHWLKLFKILIELYGDRYDFYYYLEQILTSMIFGWQARSDALKEVDFERENDPTWFHQPKMVGGALYVDLFSENLSKLEENIDYFKKLGLTYVHLMPLFAVRPGDNDGGYAVSNYRSINPKIGTIEDLQRLAEKFKKAGICLVLDFIFNHTSDDHEWAQKAQSGERRYQKFYYLFPDRKEPDEYEKTLREIFPTVRRGNFTWHDGMGQWVWTTFNSYQWDLNYKNPDVFCSMMEEMIFLANTGVDILRLDAVAFIWKQKGTMCENLPEAHELIKAYNTVCRIVCPGLLFKSEAIVHPDEVIRYVGDDKCQLSYNPLLMALLWESLATRNVNLLKLSILKRKKLPDNCLWCNYLRCHDDIGWTFDDADAASLGINAFQHRKFLNDFYTGQFEGSFARGVPFQFNPDTGDMRISGTMASLAGIEQAMELNNKEFLDMACLRVRLLHSVIMSVGGMPLLYLGEEWGLLNDYDYIKDPAKAGDSRWIHRPKMNWEYLSDEKKIPKVHQRIFKSMVSLIKLRKKHLAFTGNELEIIDTKNSHILGYVRHYKGFRIVVFANFSEHTLEMDANILRTTGFSRHFKDLITNTTIGTVQNLIFGPYQFYWLERE